MKNILVSIFVYITLARSSDSSPDTSKSDIALGSKSDSNPMITPIVPSPEHPCPSNEPVEVTLQHMPDSIKGCIKKIKEYEEEANDYCASYTSTYDLIQIYNNHLKSEEQKTSSVPKEINQKIRTIAVRVKEIDNNHKFLEIVWASYKKCKYLIEKKRKAIRNIIKEMEVKFPFKSQDGLKQFEKIPQFLDARHGNFLMAKERI